MMLDMACRPMSFSNEFQVTIQTTPIFTSTGSVGKFILLHILTIIRLNFCRLRQYFPVLSFIFLLVRLSILLVIYIFCYLFTCLVVEPGFESTSGWLQRPHSWLSHIMESDDSLFTENPLCVFISLCFLLIYIYMYNLYWFTVYQYKIDIYINTNKKIKTASTLSSTA